MLILDSNVWIHAVTIGGESESLVNEIVHGEQTAAVDPYINEEVRCNIDEDHSVNRRLRDQALEKFYRAITKCPDIHNVDSERVSEMNLEAEREKSYYKLIGAFGDIQAKDAPVLTLAYQFLTHRPTIYTNDREFASLSPTDYGVPEISIQHVDLEWVRPEQLAE
ncbi:hypothetical protein Htur_5103 (plasmid) [Haloterrigena turkmenica DSM 5511]|uniref:PIN domain-containing protein n=1 Tax=Haloterrigena turkmenica (strain ATCC 51198 / DSM 5511 / JCM 9101 / NCIMB 13204 / VKM B-1734 / 4k) TaxID=543526 RepID=D2S3P3_HALTV|nr:hypothetical protein [Haloterrigena turkmenica]ADB63990.1 hypothetical protein Htur_5103 [Haloterrigena turkmenica DSM 5511]